MFLAIIMANVHDSIQEMEESMAMIGLEEEEDGGLIYEENELSDIDVRWCLLGMFLTNHQLISRPCSTRWHPFGDQGKECMLRNYTGIPIYFIFIMKWTFLGLLREVLGRLDDSNWCLQG